MFIFQFDEPEFSMYTSGVPGFGGRGDVYGDCTCLGAMRNGGGGSRDGFAGGRASNFNNSPGYSLSIFCTMFQNLAVEVL